ncbi:MAG: HEAT repeat domain-containing protein [Planctomycetota bacterium]
MPRLSRVLLLVACAGPLGAQESQCTCAQGNASYLYLRCPKNAPADPDPCPAVVDGIHPARNPPEGWNDACWLVPRMACFLRRHAASWRITCPICAEEKCCPFPNWRNCPNCHGEAKEPVDPELPQLLGSRDQQRRIGGKQIQMAMSPHYVFVTDLGGLKITTRSGAPRLVDKHEYLHLTLQRAEMARRDFEKVFGPTRELRSAIVLVRSDMTRRSFSQAYFGNPETNLLYGGGSGRLAGGLAGNGFVLSGREDDDLHFNSRHMIGHLCISTYHTGDPFEKHLPRWIFEGAAHWLCKLHPRAFDHVYFCSHEGVEVSGSGANWDDKARKIALVGPQRDPVERMFHASTARQFNYDMHVRAWSWFDVFTREDREPFVGLVQRLRQAMEARVAVKEAFGQAPEYVDDRWRERVLSRRRDVSATQREAKNEVDVEEAKSRELAGIANETDIHLLSGKIRGLERCQNVRTARLLISLVDSRGSDRVREVISLVMGRTEDPEVLAYLVGDGYGRAGRLGRAMLARILGERGHAPARDLLRGALADDFWLVRANAARSLALLRDTESVPRLAQMAGGDAQPKARIGAMEALSRFGADAASTLPAFERNIVHPAWQVKTATCGAIKAIGNLDGVDVLLSRLDVEGGRIHEDIRKAVVALTGVDRDWSSELWIRWWAREKKARAAESKMREAIADDPPPASRGGDERYAKKREAPTYYGIKIYARAVGYVLDVSESMEQGFRVSDDIATRLGRTYKGSTRIEVCREEIAQAIQELDPRTRFNIVFFNDRVRAWKNAPIPATPDAKDSAISAVRNTPPKGQTNYFDGLREILQIRDGDDGWAANFADTPDTLFFLTDGTPTDGEITKSDELLAWFNDRNRFARLRVHVVGMGNTGIDLEFLRRLATENEGTFLHLTGEY